MNPTLCLIAASIIFTPSVQTPVASARVAELTSLARTFKVGEESSYIISFSSGGEGMHVGAKVKVKTLALIDGGKASQELSATDFTGGPDGAPDPEKVTWTFGKDGMAAADFNVKSGNVVYSMLSMLSYVPGEFTPGKEFKVSWTSPDKASTITGTGTFEGTKEIDGKQVAVIKTTLEIAPGGEMTATVHNTSTFDPANGKLIAADGKVDVGGQEMTLTIKSA